MWTRNANLPEFPLMWNEAFAYVKEMNGEARFGYRDWRLPNRKALFSLLSHMQINPALPAGHPFKNVFSGYYWTSTTCVRLPREAWYVHLGGGRVFKGMKHGSYMVWPVRSDFPASGATSPAGQPTCSSKPPPRFVPYQEAVLDKKTGLVWTRSVNPRPKALDWQSALDTIKVMNHKTAFGHDDWRLPNIRELESLVDTTSHSPALSRDHVFSQVEKFYWSSTTSTYDPRYAWVLYTEDGSVGVGYKPNASFFVWGVRSLSD
jgi:hypothetical protein